MDHFQAARKETLKQFSFDGSVCYCSSLTTRQTQKGHHDKTPTEQYCPGTKHEVQGGSAKQQLEFTPTILKQVHPLLFRETNLEQVIQFL